MKRDEEIIGKPFGESVFHLCDGHAFRLGFVHLEVFNEINIAGADRITDMKELWNKILELLGIIKTKKKYDQPAIGNTQAWYGRVNRWATSKSILTKELDQMAKSGLSGYLIEMSGWGRYSNKQWTDAWTKEVKEWYEWLLEECRTRKLWLFVSIVNDNMGKGKYGDTGPTLEKVYPMAQKLVQIVKGCGNKGVFVQAVAETQTAAGKKFEQYVISELGPKGFNLVYNGNGGHPSGAIAGMQNFAVHPSKISQKDSKAAFVVSDHGLIIRELNIGGGLENHGDPNKVKAWATNIKNVGNPVCAYYAFKVADYDGDTIKALGSILKHK